MCCYKLLKEIQVGEWGSKAGKERQTENGMFSSEFPLWTAGAEGRGVMPCAKRAGVFTIGVGLLQRVLIPWHFQPVIKRPSCFQEPEEGWREGVQVLVLETTAQLGTGDVGRAQGSITLWDQKRSLWSLWLCQPPESFIPCFGHSYLLCLSIPSQSTQTQRCCPGDF